jgi:hypothetical protein
MRIKNIDTVTGIYQGMTLTAGQEYTLETNEVNKWASNDAVLDAIINLKLQVGNDSEWIVGTSNQISELLQKNIKITNSVHQAGIAEPDGHRARLKGMCKDTIAAGTVNHIIDYKMEQLTYQGTNRNTVFDGVEYYSANADNFDEITFQVVDKDGLGVLAGWYDQATFDAMGNIYVVEEFGDKVFVMPDAYILLRFYRSQIVPGLYLRAIYSSYGNTDVKYSMNLIRHLVE